MNHNTAKDYLVIEAGKTNQYYWSDLWRFRDLFYYLAWRDILVRYKQTAIGIAWSVLRPLLTMIIFVIVFNKVANLSSGEVPYPIMVFAAILPWYLFSNALQESSNSLVANASMVSKIFFPRMLVPLSCIFVSLVDFFISFVLLCLLMALYGYLPGANIFFLPFFLVLTLIVATGTGLWFAALNVKYRDVRFIVPFTVQIGLYISPVGFSSELIPENWRLLYSLNPMVGVIDGFRWCLFGENAPLYVPGILTSLASAVLLVFIGFIYFRKTERTFADII